MEVGRAERVEQVDVDEAAWRAARAVLGEVTRDGGGGREQLGPNGMELRPEPEGAARARLAQQRQATAEVEAR